MFESPENTEPTSLEEEKNRKESFQKAKEKFKDVDVDLPEPVDEVDSANDCSYDNGDDSNTELDEEAENERRKSEFKAKQQLFNSQNSC